MKFIAKYWGKVYKKDQKKGENGEKLVERCEEKGWGLMQSKEPKAEEIYLISGNLLDLINPRHPLILLSKKIPWGFFDKEFSRYYKESGRPAKRTRLMVGLLILKQMYNLSDRKVVEEWVQNPYFQAFCGEVKFNWRYPCSPSDLSHFRKRIGRDGVEKIFEISVRLHGEKAEEKEIIVDTTVQEKNITFPTDLKLRKKIIGRCREIAFLEGVQLRRSYKRELKE